MLEQGYIQVYTGDGKGKTTAALGQALRAVGRGLKVVVYQFLKGSSSGELETAQRLTPDLSIVRLAPAEKLFWQLNEEELGCLRNIVHAEYQKLRQTIASGAWDIIILDELMGALRHGLLSEEEVRGLLEAKPPQVELILTGRKAPDWILEKADLVTEMKMLKHYLARGVTAREGIER